MRVAGDLLHHYQHVISELVLITGSKGVFDVTVDGVVLYSKHASGRHAKADEVLDLFTQQYATETPRYER